jgi:hypothetical protein
MKFSVEVNPGHHCAVIDLTGTFDLPSFREACGRLIIHPDWKPDFDVIVVIGTQTDLNEATLARLNDVKTFAQTWNAENRTGADPKTAIVCTNELKRVIADLWVAMVDKDWPIRLGVFTSVKEALAWFAAPADPSGR